ncbi:unnamed protein product [Clonostachys rosea]|uniref:Epoxide hydrolase N-terminal domain-containing protein n=1 Tax=Bionectria ochroleuca TaxID=29856 RepID=A0ABY6UZ57_BIOOC|nr:unnamed protein product [Clonostachys rosea]
MFYHACVIWLSLAASSPAWAWNTEGFKFPQGPYPTPFKIVLNDDFITMTLQKVKDYRPTVGLTSSWNIEGPPTHNITELAQYWSDEYNWASIQQKINDDFRHLATVIEGDGGNYTADVPLHFIHQRAANDNAIPLLLLHGWPSTSLEWSKVIEPLTTDTNSPFHVVAPDLPGFGFSPALTKPGLSPATMGRILNKLMLQLGYTRYGLVTTDLGWFAGMWMMSEVEENIIGHFTDFVLVTPSNSDMERIENGTATEEEVANAEAGSIWSSKHAAYSTTHAQKPLALAHAIADSPVGLLAWYWDVNYATSDGYLYSKEELVTDAMMLWVPGPYANMRFYLEFFTPEAQDFPSSNVSTGVTEWGWGHGPFPEIGALPFALRAI